MGTSGESATKRCHTCETPKPLSEFTKDRSRKDGLCSRCVGCDSAKKRKYRAEHPEYEANRVRPAGYFTEYTRRRTAKDPTFSSAKFKAWKNANRVANRDNQRNAISRKRLRGGIAEKVNYREIIARDNGTCYLCKCKPTGKDLHFDHVIPLSKGGDHTAANIKVACALCNAYKGTKILEVAA